MHFLRKLGLGIALLFYTPLLLLLPTLVSLNATVIKPSFVKETLVKAEFYQGLSSYFIEQASKNESTAGNSLVISSLQQTATPDAIQKVIEPTVDNTYKWLDNPDGNFDVSVSLKPIQDSFLKALEQNFGQKLSTLPKCTSKTATVPADTTQITCIPQGTSAQQILDQAKTEFSQNKDLLGEQENIALGETTSDPAAQQTDPTTDDSPQKKKETPKLDTSQLQTYAKLYHWIKVGTPIALGLTLLATLAIALLSRPRLKGVRRIGIFMVTNGVILIATSFVMAYMLKTFLPVPAAGESLAVSGSKAADIISDKVLSINRLFSYIYLIGGVVTIITSLILQKVLKKNAQPSHIEREDMLPEDTDLDEKPAPDKPAEPEESVSEAAPVEKPIEKKIAIK